MSRVAALLVVAILLATGASACGGGHCAGLEADESPGTPVVDNFWVLEQQIPGDPWTVLFGVDYTDDDGDLGTGSAEFYLNESKDAAVQDMVDAFRQSGVQPGQTSGSVWMALRFSDTVDDGTHVTLGLQLVDAAGHRSNCYTVELRFDVEPVAQHGLGSRRVIAMRRVACGEPGS
jgi:hypothetical protein